MDEYITLRNGKQVNVTRERFRKEISKHYEEAMRNEKFVIAVMDELSKATGAICTLGKKYFRKTGVTKFSINVRSYYDERIRSEKYFTPEDVREAVKWEFRTLGKAACKGGVPHASSIIFDIREYTVKDAINAICTYEGSLEGVMEAFKTLRGAILAKDLDII